MTDEPMGRLADRPWPQVQHPVVLVPLGSTEQHGPHLPLDTDTAIATKVAMALSTRLASSGTDAVVAPAIAYGASGEHEAFPGTISIGTEALARLLLEYGRSACSWAAWVVFVNGHGGNIDALSNAVSTLLRESRRAAWLPCTLGASHSSSILMDAHAGRTETSLMLEIDAARVQDEFLEPGNIGPLAEILSDLRESGVRRASPNGILGDPRGAHASEGRELLDALVFEAWSRLTSGNTDARGCLVRGAG